MTDLEISNLLTYGSFDGSVPYFPPTATPVPGIYAGPATTFVTPPAGGWPSATPTPAPTWVPSGGDYITPYAPVIQIESGFAPPGYVPSPQGPSSPGLIQSISNGLAAVANSVLPGSPIPGPSGIPLPSPFGNPFAGIGDLFSGVSGMFSSIMPIMMMMMIMNSGSRRDDDE